MGGAVKIIISYFEPDFNRLTEKSVLSVKNVSCTKRKSVI